MTIDRAWSQEQQRWAEHYAALLRDRLHWAIAHAHDRATPPDRLIDHFESFLHLIGAARDRAEIQPLALDLIDALHPWPARWGHGDRWIEELRFAANAAAQRNQPARQANLLAELAALLLTAGRLDETIRISEQALSVARECAAVVPWAVAAEAYLSAARQRGQIDAALRYLQARDAEWPDVSAAADPTARVVAQAHLGFQRVELLKAQSRFDEALDVNRHLIADLEAVPEVDRTVLAEVYSTLGFVYYPQGAYPEALAAIERALELRLQAGDRALEASERGNLGLIYVNLAQFDRAEPVFRQMVADTDRLRMRASHMCAIALLASVAYLRGQLSLALQYDEHAIALAEELGNDFELPRLRGHRAAVLLRMERYAEALPGYEATVAMYEQQGRRYGLTATLGGLSYCLLKLGQTDRAWEVFRQLRDLVEELNRPILQSVVLRYRAFFESPTQAVDTLRAALIIARDLRRRFDEAGCLLALSGVVTDEAERQALWQAGAVILQECGATAWLAGHSPDNPPTLPVSV